MTAYVDSAEPCDICRTRHPRAATEVSVETWVEFLDNHPDTVVAVQAVRTMLCEIQSLRNELVDIIPVVP